jgi:hypothetical protein
VQVAAAGCSKSSPSGYQGPDLTNILVELRRRFSDNLVYRSPSRSRDRRRCAATLYATWERVGSSITLLMKSIGSALRGETCCLELPQGSATLHPWAIFGLSLREDHKPGFFRRLFNLIRI